MVLGVSGGDHNHSSRAGVKTEIKHLGLPFPVVVLYIVTPRKKIFGDRVRVAEDIGFLPVSSDGSFNFSLNKMQERLHMNLCVIHGCVRV